MAALASLLVDLFEAYELRWWIREHYPEHFPALPAASVPPIEMADKVVGLLDRHGKIDEQMFDHLLNVRERHHDRIESVRSIYLQALLSDQPEASHELHTHRWKRLYSRALQCSVTLSAYGVLTRGFPRLDVSKALRSGENALFSFLPFPYQRLALPALIISAVLLTILFRLLFRQNLRRPTMKDNE